MDKIAIENKTNAPMWVGSRMIPAGEFGHFDAHELPPHLRPDTPKLQQAPAPDPVAELAGKSVAEIRAAVPDLSDEDLARLGDIEQGKGAKARKGVLEAIAEVTLARAAAE